MIPIGEAKQTVKLPSGVQSINLPDYALQNWGMKVVEVANLDDALKLAFSNIGKIDINKASEQNLPDFVPENISYAPQLWKFANLSMQYVSDTKVLLGQAKTSLSTTLLNDSSLLNALLAELTQADSQLQDSEIMLDKNYLYSAANNSFLAKANAMLVKDIAENPSLLQDNSTAFDLKVEDLKKKTAELETEINSGMPLDDLEYYVSAQQRLTWAEINIETITNTQTIVVSSDPTAQQDYIVQKLQDFEFASAWAEIAQQMYDLGKNSGKKILPENDFEQQADDYIVKAENSLTLASQDSQKDITRRVNSARINKARKWFIAAAFDAASATALVDSETAVQGKDSAAIYSMLTEKISAVESEIKNSKHEIYWANLYLDHAKYFLNAYDFYQKNGQGSKANQSLQDGLSLAYLAEANFEVAEKVYSLYDNVLQSRFITTGNQQSNGNKIPVTQAAMIVAIVIVAMLFVFFVSLKIFSSKQEQKAIQKQIGSVSRQKQEIEKEFAQKKISESDYSVLEKEAGEQLSFLTALREKRSRQIIQVDELNARILALERELSSLRKDYSRGEILGKDFQKTEGIVREKIGRTKKLLEQTRKDLREEKIRPEKKSSTKIISRKKASTTSNLYKHIIF